MITQKNAQYMSGWANKEGLWIWELFPFLFVLRVLSHKLKQPEKRSCKVKSTHKT